MESSLRPWLTTGVALVSAGAVAVAPTTLYIPEKPAAVAVSAPTPTAFPDVQLTAVEWPYILSLPIVRARIGSELETLAVFLGGWARSGIGLADSLLTIPGVTVEIIQQIFDLDFTGALNTFTTAVRDAVVAIGDPLLQSWIWRGQKDADQRSAFFAAYPQAIIDVTNGFLDATGVVVDQALLGTRQFIAAVLTFNLGNIINAAVDGIGEFAGAVGEGAGLIVDGIESAQMAIAAAWQAGPPPPFSATASTSVSAADAMPDLGATVVSLSAGPAGAEAPESDAPDSEAEPADAPEAEPVAVSDIADEAKTPAAEVSTETTESDEPAPQAAPEPDEPPAAAEAAAAAEAEKPDRPTPVKDALKRIKKDVKESVDKARDSAEKAAKPSKATQKTDDSADKTESADKTDKAEASVGAGDSDD